MISIFHRFWLRLGEQLGPMLATFLGPRRPKRLPKPLQDDPRCLQKRPGWPKTAKDASKPAPEPSGPRFWCLQAWIWMVICRNADPFLDGFGIILTMQIPSRLHVIEASKAFSKIAFVKELPVCSSIRTKNTLLKKSTRPLYVPAMARRLPKPLKEKVLKCDGKLITFYVLTIILKDTQNKALSVHLFRLNEHQFFSLLKVQICFVTTSPVI